MAPRNPSELARLEEKLEANYLKAKNLGFSKAAREFYMAEARKIEKQLGLPPKDLV